MIENLFALRIILIPFSIIYSVIIFTRNKFYDIGIFKSQRISKPIISIGNITTGGTGKTPLTIFIAKHYLNKNKKVGIVSRGYKRKLKDFILVSDGTLINANVDQSGDELILIANELLKHYKDKFFIAAGKDRVEASNFLIDKFNPDIIILDDAFQYRRIKRNLDIVIIDATDYLKNKFLNSINLPSGNLRENFSNLKRANLIIQNNKADNLNEIQELRQYQNEVLLMRYKTEYFMDSKNSILQNCNSNAIVFSGIANDDSFIKMVNERGINIIERIKFPDHYNYIEQDINSFKEKYSDGNIFITTEKDFIKVKHFEDFTTDYPVYYLKMEIELNENKNVLYKKLNELAG